MPKKGSASSPIRSILVANRGEIARRIIRTCEYRGIRSVALYSDVDKDLAHVQEATEAVALLGSESEESYRNIEKVVAAALESKVDAVHPGYGFLSENPALPKALEKLGIRFIGPPARVMERLGDKISAKKLALEVGVPLAPSFQWDGTEPGISEVVSFAKKLSKPLIVKASSGGGGRGMQKVSALKEIPEALHKAAREAEKFFGKGLVYVEALIEPARHIEVQIFGDTFGEVVSLYDRDCTFQRNHQKIIEEAPAPGLTSATRAALHNAALALCKKAGYINAGTVEFLLDHDQKFYFLEVNSRLQVEHPVTECITGLDLVSLQIDIAEGRSLMERPLSLPPVNSLSSAIELRLCAENPAQNFLVSTGKITTLSVPTENGVRFDTGFRPGDEVSHYYDSLLGKIIVNEASRNAAIEAAKAAVKGTTLFGVHSNLSFLHSLLSSKEFKNLSHSITCAPELLDSPSLKAQLKAIALFYIDKGLYADSSDPWDTLKGFSNVPNAGTTHAVSVNDTPFTVIVQWSSQSSLLVRDEKSGTSLIFEEIVVRKGEATYLLEGQLQKASLGSDGWIKSDDGIFQVGESLTRTNKDLDYRSSTNEVISPLPGKVLAILATLGDTVNTGDKLVVLESMKMEHPLVAPRSGIVKSVSVSVGDMVQSKKVLMTLG